MLTLSSARPESARSRTRLRPAIVKLKRASVVKYPRDGVLERTLTVDSPVPFSIHKLWFDLHKLVNATHTATGAGQNEDSEALLLDSKGQPVELGDAMKVIPPRYQPQADQSIYLSSSGLNLRRPLETLASRLRDPRLAFLFTPGCWMVQPDGRVDADLDELLQPEGHPRRR